MVSAQDLDTLKAYAGRLPSVQISERSVCDLQLLASGAFSPFDRFIAGEASAISDSAKRGWELFNTKARCQKCHALSDNERDVTLFIDNDFHNIGIGILRHRVGPLAQQAGRDLAQGHLPGIDQAAIASDLSVLGRFLDQAEYIACRALNAGVS